MEGSNTAAEEAVTIAEPKLQTRIKRQPNYAVIIENDDFHSFEYVIEAIQKVCGHSIEKAYALTLEAHTKGKAIVWSGPLEVAELKGDQLRGIGPDFFALKPVTFPLGVQIEPLSS